MAAPDGCGACFERLVGAFERLELVFLLPVLLEALLRVDALLRLREGEDARVAMI